MQNLKNKANKHNKNRLIQIANMVTRAGQHGEGQNRWNKMYKLPVIE